MTTQEHKILEERIKGWKFSELSDDMAIIVANGLINELIASRNELATKLAEANDTLNRINNLATNSQERSYISIQNLIAQTLSRTFAPKPGE